MNALSLLKTDHGNVEHLFTRFEGLHDDELEEKARVRDLIVEQLSVHAAIEEQLLYPALRERLDEEHVAVVLEGLEEHHVAKWTLNELLGMAPGHERFDAKLRVLIESVRHHVQEEEDDLFPAVREAFTVEELERMGEAMEKAKKTAPTKPHPRMPDTPPLNVLLGTPIAIADRAFDLGKGAVGKVIDLTAAGVGRALDRSRS